MATVGGGGGTPQRTSKHEDFRPTKRLIRNPVTCWLPWTGRCINPQKGKAGASMAFVLFCRRKQQCEQAEPGCAFSFSPRNGHQMCRLGNTVCLGKGGVGVGSIFYRKSAMAFHPSGHLSFLISESGRCQVP